MSAPTPTPMPQNVPSVSCMYVYDPVTRCESQRPCDSCLAKPGCMVGSIGACQPLSVKPDDPWHYSRAALRNLTLPGLKDSTNASAMEHKQVWEFPSIEATYCPVDDAVCKQCTQKRFWLPPTVVAIDNRLCVGANGCVCIFNCEFNKNALETTCPRSPMPTLYTEESTDVATAAPPWTMPPLVTTTPPTPSTPPRSGSVVVGERAASKDSMDTVLIVAACFFGVSCLAWLVYYGWRRCRIVRSVPMAIVVRIDTPRHSETGTHSPSQDV